LNGLGEQLLFRAVMAEGQFLGDETVEFWRKIGRHVGLREHYITIGVWFERLAKATDKHRWTSQQWYPAQGD
jgi:hypothetical protein